MAIYRDGKRLEGDEAKAAMKTHMARFNPSGGGSPKAAQRSGGSGSKGGSNPDLDPREDRELLQRRLKETTTDKSWGYYKPSGEYVSGLTDRFDGGGMNTTGTYFEGGPLSTLLNVAKIRPAGMSRERQTIIKDGQVMQGDYIVPRENIGFRNLEDMTNRGGPQASGGPYQGGPYGLSNIFNALDQIGGVDQGERVAYDNPAMDAYNRRILGLMEIPQNSQAYLEAKRAEEQERLRRLNIPRDRRISVIPMLRPPAVGS